MVIDILLIMVAALGAAGLSEAVSWLLIYRTSSYKILKANIDRLQEKVDKQKAQPLVTQKAKKVERFEESLDAFNKEMSLTKMKSVFAVGITMIGFFAFMNRMYDGKIVAKLPFEPISFVTSLSHRNIPGEDYTECAMMFIYVLSSMAIRNNLQKVLGTAPAKNAPNPFWNPPKTS